VPTSGAGASDYLVLGENAIEVERIWNKVYEGTIYHGRGGLGIVLISALDNALHDLRGKLLGVPSAAPLEAALLRMRRYSPACHRAVPGPRCTLPASRSSSALRTSA
jgi:hypothetical protein